METNHIPIENMIKIKNKEKYKQTKDAKLHNELTYVMRVSWYQHVKHYNTPWVA
jgi:hypothetical protein